MASRAATRACSRVCGIARDLVREHGDERLDARRLVGERPGAGVEADAAETAREPLEPDLEVLRERERRVVETAADDALVARDHRLGRVGPRVGDEAEVRPRTPLGREQREVPLVALHDRDDHAVGEIEEPLRERAAQHGRPLREVHDLAHDPRRIGPAGMRGEPVLDRLAAPICIGHHEGPGQLALVRARVGQLDLAAQEAVAARRAPRADAAELDLDDVAAVQADEPADRACEAQLLAAPAHVLRERETLDETVDDLGQHLRGGSRIGVDLGEHEPVAAHERARRHVVPPREARAGGRRLAVGPEGHRLRRAAVHETIGRLGHRHVLCDDRDAPRRDERPDGARGEAPLEEQALDEWRGLRQRRLARVRRQLLAPDLDEERAHASTGGSTMARCACATRRARFRTRPM